jgi:hypothetical protein
MDSGLLDTFDLPLQRPAEAPVRVWLLQGKYSGDNAQVRALGEHLARRFGWSCEPRQVRFHAAHKKVRERLPEAIDFAKSDSLSGPFPDVLVSCSRFYGMVGAWLKQQAARSTERPMVHVHLGRIAAPMSSFDLLAATAQYGLPRVPNFVPLTLPFVPQGEERTAAAVAAWAPRLEGLPRPWTVLLVGGPLTQIPFDADTAERIAGQAITSARGAGGALIAVVGRRTPGPARRRIAARLAAETELPSWFVDWPAPEPNPYAAVLALGDRFMVTCDSASMIADGCISGKPMELVRLPITTFLKRLSSRGLGLSLDARRRRRGRNGLAPDRLDRLRDWLVAQYWMRPWDEMRDFLHEIERNGLLAPEPGDDARRIQAKELDTMAARIAGLVAARRSGVPDRIEPVLIPAEAA